MREQRTSVPVVEAGRLPVMEMFYTIQGEGYHTGTAAFFIRLGGCDVGCHWCDVKESWNAGAHMLHAVGDIVAEVMKHPAKTVVITGGEPLMYNLDELCKALKDQDLRVNIETSGAYDFSGSFDWICVSPKKFKPPVKAMLGMADELKVIVFNRSDLEWAVKNSKETAPECLLFLQPEWDKREEVLPMMLEFIKQNPEWRLSLQTHKWLGIP
jgi:7-carboxy-7-deazaguanine synthase